MPDTVMDQQIVDDSSTVSSDGTAQHPTNDITPQPALSPSGSVPDFGQLSTTDPSLNTETHHVTMIYDMLQAQQAQSFSLEMRHQAVEALHQSVMQKLREEIICLKETLISKSFAFDELVKAHEAQNQAVRRLDEESKSLKSTLMMLIPENMQSQHQLSVNRERSGHVELADNS